MSTATLRRLLVAAVFIPAVIRAQQAPPVTFGLVGGFGFGVMNWDLGARSARGDFLGGLNAGYRIPFGKRLDDRITVTPHVSVMMTEFRGIALNSNEIGVSRFDAGVEVAFRFWKLHPFALLQAGRVTTEQYVDTNLVNYSGAMPALGGGLRLQLDNPCRAGPELTVRHTAGDLVSGEWRVKGSNPPPAGRIEALIVTLGWSGRFRGNRWLFACH